MAERALPRQGFAVRRHRGRVRRPAFVTACVLGVSMLAGACGGIPSSGAVHAGVEVEGAQPVRVLAVGPVDGASEIQTVQGFLRAQPGLDDDSSVAREFLAGAIAQAWALRPSVVVYPDESSLTITSGAGGAVTVSTPVVATVDDQGAYAAAPVGAKATLHLKLARVGGQWRITSLDPPQTRWLTGYDLDRAYRPNALYYLAPGTKTLVPDVRWYPVTPGLATAIARGELGPPSPYLRQAVATGIPTGTALGVDSVPSTGSLATVALNSAALQAGAGGRATMYAQLAAAVLQAPGVDKVRLEVGGTPLDLPGLSVTSGATAIELGYTIEPAVTSDPATFVSSGAGTVLSQLVENGQAGAPRRPADLPKLGAALRSLAISVDSREYAGVSPDGQELLRMVTGHAPAVVLRAPGLTRPSYDALGWLWTTSSGRGVSTRVRAVLTGQATPLAPVQVVTPAAPWLAGRQITALRVSRDGARAVVTSYGRGGWRIDLAGVVRDATGRPTALTTPVRLALGFTDVVDATWVDSITVAILGRTGPDTSPEPYLVGVGAETTPLPEVKGAAALAAGTGESTVDVVTSGGTILARGGAGWTQVAKATGIAFPG